MSRVASLGMYDPPPLHAANDRLWRAIAERLRQAGVAGVPDRLDRDRPLDAIWDDPTLLLAQTCGYPLTTRWRDRLTYVATPLYAAPGCEGHYHRSRFVVRRDDAATDLGALAGRRAAINEATSNTGMNLLRRAVAPLSAGRPFFAGVIVTGSHASSLDAVAQGAADVAAIDAVTFAHLSEQQPALTARVRTIGWSLPVPNLPFVTSRSTDPALVDQLRRAVDDSILAEPEAAGALRLRASRDIGLAAYDRVTEIEEAACRLGYPALQ